MKWHRKLAAYNLLRMVPFCIWHMLWSCCGDNSRCVVGIVSGHDDSEHNIIAVMFSKRWIIDDWQPLIVLPNLRADGASSNASSARGSSFPARLRRLLGSHDLDGLVGKCRRCCQIFWDVAKRPYCKFQKCRICNLFFSQKVQIWV